MSSDLAIRVDGLGKAYTIRHQQNDHVTLAQVALNRVKHPFHRNATEQFWALQDVDFEVNRGEVIGLIGRNGAGKSTLLKLLTRITVPTAGRIDLWGRVGSLLEVGTGFHGELTGRENMYLNGSILGMSRTEIDRQFDSIVEFAGIEKFLDTPVKRYSSGMYVRLAFAVAAHLATEILLLDEVLAVGDADFQKKCLGTVEQLAKEGRAVILVSHNAGLISRNTQRSIVLDHGHVAYVGETAEAISYYRTGAGDSKESVYIASDADRADIPLNRELEIRSIGLPTNSTGIVASDTDLDIELALTANTVVQDARLHIGVVTTDGVTACGGTTPACLSFSEGEERSIIVRLPTPRLAPGHYSLNISTGHGDQFNGFSHYDALVNVHPFDVTPAVREDGAVGSFWNESWGLTRLRTPEVIDVPDHASGQ